MGRTCTTNQLVDPVGDAVGAARGIVGTDTVAIAGRTVAAVMVQSSSCR